MAQVGWVFLSEQGGQHRVGLYHGDKSGHLAIHCDRRVVQIDFSVKETRKYSFFIEDDLCEISLIKEHGRFSYEFSVNKTADTPLNQARKLRGKRNRRAMSILIGGLVVALALIFATVFYYRQKETTQRLSAYSMFSQPAAKAERQLNEQGKTTETELLIVKEGKRRVIFYGFAASDSLRITGHFSVSSDDEIILPNGFPLTDRDAFTVLFLPSDPQVHLVDFSRPSKSTLQNYATLAVAAEQKAHPEKSDHACNCLAAMVLQENGWRALGNMIFQDRAPEDSPVYNKNSYARMLRDEKFAPKLKERCWDQ
jgi:hypothetical protein